MEKIDHVRMILASQQEHRDKFTSSFDHWADYVYGSIMVLIGVVSLIGNGLAICVFHRKGRDITLPEVFLYNIAVVDVFLAGASYPATIVAAFSHRWIFGEIGCKIYGATCYFLGLATIMSLTALAVVRLIKICFPLIGQPPTRTGRISSLWILLGIYFYSLIWSLIPFIFGWGDYDVEPFGLSCTLAWMNPDHNGKIYIASVSVFCIVLPAFVIIGSHVGIFIKIKRSCSIMSNRENGQQSIKAENQFVLLSFFVCSGFLIAWFPYAAVSLWSAFIGGPHSIPIWITPIPVLLAKSSIAYNPVIYVFLIRRYREEFSEGYRDLLYNFWNGVAAFVRGPTPREVVGIL